MLPAGSVIITPTKMYEEMQDIGKKVDHLASVIDPAIHNIREDIREGKEDRAMMKADNKILEVRIRALENWRWFVLGVAALVAPAGGFVLSILFAR